MLFEKVYDVAASGDRVPDRHGALPPVGDTVDVTAAAYRNDIGAAELSAAWTDPDFDLPASLFACLAARTPVHGRCAWWPQQP
jgi:hypothetical protein